MLSEVFYWIVNMSIIGSITGLIILILREIKVIPRLLVYLIWPAVLIRMTIPFGITNEFSLMNFVSKFTTKTVSINGIESLPGFSASNFIMGADKYFPIEYKTKLLENVFGIASLIWIIIALAAIFSAGLLYYFTKSEIKNAIHIKDNIYESLSVATPTVYGIFNPKIILPEGIPENNIEYILVHEKVHIKRKDNLIRVVAIMIACLHWFNPFVWIMLKSFFIDMELTCDAKVLKNMSKNEKKDYAAALFECSGNSKTFMASAFGTSKIKVRIENILSYKKLTITSSIFFVMLFAAVIIVLLTNAEI